MPELVRLKGLHIDRVAFVEAGDNPKAHVSFWKSLDYGKADYSTEQRVAMAKKGEAIAVRDADGNVVDGSFPIANVADLKKAIKAFGRAGDKAAAKAHIKKRAKALDSADLIPESWSTKSFPGSDMVSVDALTWPPATGPKPKKVPWFAKRDASDATFVVEKEDESVESYNDQIDEISGAWQAQIGGTYEECGWVREVYPDHIVVSRDGENYSVTYSTGADGEISFDLASAVEVQQTWVVVKGDQEAGDRKESTVAPTRKDLPDDLPEEVTKYLDAIEKEAADAVAKLDAVEKEKADAAKAKADAEGTTEAEALAKALKDADPAIAKAIEQLRDESKAATEKADEATAKAAAAETEVEKLRVEKADGDAIEKAKALKYLTLKPEEVGPAMRKLAEVDSELHKVVEATLVSANATSSEAFREIGKDRGGATSEVGGDAEAKIDALAKAYAEKHEVSVDVARTEVIETEEGRALMAAFEDDRLEGVDR